MLEFFFIKLISLFFVLSYLLWFDSFLSCNVYEEICIISMTTRHFLRHIIIFTFFFLNIFLIVTPMLVQERF